MSESSPVDRRQLFRGLAVASSGIVLAGAVDLTGLGAEAEAAAAAAAPKPPRIYKPPEWGAQRPQRGPTILNRKPDRLIVHHTATANASDRSLEHAFALSRSIQSAHINQGWGDSGQHFTISRGGHLMVGRKHTMAAIDRGRHLQGVHVANHNSHTLGIENEGNYTTVQPPEELVKSLVATLAWLCGVYSLDPQRAIIGHRDLNATACPGNLLYRMLPEIRDQVARKLRRPANTRQTASLIDDAPANLPGQRESDGHGPSIGSGEPVR
jgi:hypothetical protein